MVGGVGGIPPAICASAPQHAPADSLANARQRDEKRPARPEHFVQRGHGGRMVINFKEGLQAQDAIELVLWRGGSLSQVQPKRTFRIVFIEVDNFTVLDANSTESPGVVVIPYFGHAAPDGVGVVGQKALDV